MTRSTFITDIKYYYTNYIITILLYNEIILTHTFRFIFFLIFPSFSFSSSVRASTKREYKQLASELAVNRSLYTHLSHIYSPLASSRFKSLASTLLRRSIILGLGGLPGRRAGPPFVARTLRGFSLSGFGGRPRRPVMAIIIEGTSSLAKSTHFIPYNMSQKTMRLSVQ